MGKQIKYKIKEKQIQKEPRRKGRGMENELGCILKIILNEYQKICKEWPQHDYVIQIKQCLIVISDFDAG